MACASSGPGRIDTLNETAVTTIDPAEYCRELEAYLCRKNEGHLIRIAGPVFVQVSGWAAQGVPLTVACRGIDRYCERYYAKGPNLYMRRLYLGRAHRPCRYGAPVCPTGASYVLC